MASIRAAQCFRIMGEEHFVESVEVVQGVGFKRGTFGCGWPLLIALAFVVGLLVGRISQPFTSANSVFNVGRVEDFPPGSVTAIELPAAFNDPAPRYVLSATQGTVTEVPFVTVSPVRIFLVHDPSEGFVALYNRDPHLGCRIKWAAGNLRFEDPCHGSKYTRTGEYIEGPSLRSLDRFFVRINDDRDVLIDVSKFQLGSRHP